MELIVKKRCMWNCLGDTCLMPNGFKVKFVSKKIRGGFVGMNSECASTKGIPWDYGANTILVWNGMKGEARLHTINHEKIELALMRLHGWSYQKAHKRALQLETKGDE
jgi:hypothetical protein